MSGNQSCPGFGLRAATTVASTTVSSMLTSTAPVAWRAISPVSIVTVCLPQVNVFFAISNTDYFPFNIARAFSPAARFADKRFS